MKEVFIVFCLFGLISCKTLTPSVSLGAGIGALTGAGLGGAIHYQNRKKAAVVAGAAGALVGAGIAYMVHKNKESDFEVRLKDLKEKESEKAKAQASEALNQCLGEEVKPLIVPNFVPSEVKGGKLIGARTDWIIKPNSQKLTPEKEEMLEELKKGDNNE